MKLVDQIIALGKAYGASRDIGVHRVSALVFGDGMVLTRLEGGADITTKRFENGVQWFSNHWPEGVAWPDGISRPQPELQEMEAEAAAKKGKKAA